MLFGIFCLSLALGAPALTDEAINNSYILLRVDDDNDPVGRLLIALAARERNASGSYSLCSGWNTSSYCCHVDPRGFKIGFGLYPTITRLKAKSTSKRIDHHKKYQGHATFGEICCQFIGDLFWTQTKKVEGVRVGKLNAVEVLLEISVTDRREGKIVKQVHLGKPSLLSTNEKIREQLTRHFGGRPAQPSTGPYSELSVQSPSFESSTSLTQEWGVSIGELMGAIPRRKNLIWNMENVWMPYSV